MGSTWFPEFSFCVKVPVRGIAHVMSVPVSFFHMMMGVMFEIKRSLWDEYECDDDDPSVRDVLCQKILSDSLLSPHHYPPRGRKYDLTSWPKHCDFRFDSFAYYSLRRFWIITVVASVLIFDPKSNSLFTNCVFQHLSMHEKRKAITRYITLSWSPKNHKLPYNGILLKFNIVLNFRIKELCMSARSSNWSNLGSKLLSVMPTIFSNQWQTVQRKLIFTPKNKY